MNIVTCTVAAISINTSREFPHDVVPAAEECGSARHVRR